MVILVFLFLIVYRDELIQYIVVLSVHLLSISEAREISHNIGTGSSSSIDHVEDEDHDDGSDYDKYKQTTQ